MSRPSQLALLLILASSFNQPAAAESFKSAKMLAIPGGVDYVLSADLNADGKMDLIYLPSATPGVPPFVSPMVALGIGDGTFAAAKPVQLPVGNFGNFGRFAISDVNKDGKLDLIVTAGNGTSSNIAVLLGNGDGTFQPGIVSAGPTSNLNFINLQPRMAIADFDGDGAVDIVIADTLNNTVSLLLGDNHGHFTLKTILANAQSAIEIYPGDFNGDGHMDFLARGYLSNEVHVWINNGDATFKLPVAYTGPNFAAGLAVHDMNNDGRADLVVANFNGGIDILLGNADGTFSNVSAGGSSYAGFDAGNLIVGDFDGDGILDIAASSHNGVGILRGKGNLTYEPVREFPATPFPYILAPGDFNGDGFTDFAVPSEDGMVLLFGNADGSLQTADAYDVRHTVLGTASGDFNGDHKIDLAVGVVDEPPRILLGVGDGTFTITPDPNLTNTAFAGLTAVGDFDGDHKTDLLADGGGGFVQLGHGDGTFDAPSTLPNLPMPLSSAFSAEFNNDGVNDFAFFGFQSVVFFTAKPDHTYTQFTANLPATPTIIVGTLAFADVNHDGKLDVIVNISTGSTGGGMIEILLGNGDGTFVTGASYATAGCASTAIAIGDIDGDSNPDIILCSGSGSINPILPTGLAVQVLYGNGDGTFQNPISFPTQHAVTVLAAADLNLDGIADLVTSNGFMVTVMHGARNRTLGPPRDYVAGDSPTSPVIVDLNGDGGPDLIFANSETNATSTVTVLLNLGITNGTLNINPSPAVYGQPVLLSASFVGTVAAAGIPTGSVAFAVDNSPAGAAPLQGGTASFNDPLLVPPGTHTVAANWSGDDTFNPHNLSAQLVVTKASSTTNLSATPAVAVVGQTVSVIARVVPPFQGTPTGTIQFQPASGSPSSATLDSAASAALSVDTSKLALGNYSYTASYSGDANFNPSTSAAAQFKVTDFTIAVVPSSLTVTAGSSGNATVTASSSSGFNGTVDLSCTGLPANAHCVFTPASISLAAATSASSAFTIATANSATLLPFSWQRTNGRLPHSLQLITILLALCLFTSFVLSRRRAHLIRHPLPYAYAAALFVFIVCIATGCGGGTGGRGTPRSATYAVQVVATVHGSAPPTSHTASVTLVIQQ